ncbi:MAG: hypothetical protein EKK46_07435 [Rhodocyclaceae bacterium]|nr:MAG: hypothetical protein EKK46_07435 [Rhodocyclaceae bacterium]
MNTPYSDPPSSGRFPAGGRCPRCGGAVECGISLGRQTCWCMDLPPLGAASIQGEGCYCQQCLKALLAEPQAPGSA